MHHLELPYFLYGVLKRLKNPLKISKDISITFLLELLKHNKSRPRHLDANTFDWFCISASSGSSLLNRLLLVVCVCVCVCFFLL